MTTSRAHAYYEELAAAHVLGVLEEPERSELVAHITEGCSICRVVYPQLVDVADLLLLGADAAAPPPGLKERIMAAATGTGTGSAGSTDVDRPVGPSPPLRLPTRASSREPLYRGLALAASLALVLLTWQSLTWKKERDAARQSLLAESGQVSQLREEIRGLEAGRAEQARLLELIERPGSGLVTLASLDPAPGALGKVLYDSAAGKGYLWVKHLPVDAEGKDYQLWAIQGGAPVSAGVFSVTADGSALIPLADVRPDTRVAAFAITLEPAGGLPAPSGPMVLLGNTGS
ncbi:MAG TPA: anti-sigma factor [Candidatus Eisenbacteria bacterium]